MAADDAEAFRALIDPNADPTNILDFSAILDTAEVFADDSDWLLSFFCSNEANDDRRPTTAADEIEVEVVIGLEVEAEVVLIIGRC